MCSGNRATLARHQPVLLHATKAEKPTSAHSRKRDNSSMSTIIIIHRLSLPVTCEYSHIFKQQKAMYKTKCLCHRLLAP